MPKTPLKDNPFTRLESLPTRAGARDPAPAAAPIAARGQDLLSRLRASQIGAPPRAVTGSPKLEHFFPQAGLKTLRPPLYETTLPAGFDGANQFFFSENAVPFNSMVLPASGNYDGDSLTPRHIAQAALKANPAIQFIVPTRQPFTSTQDPRFAEVRAELAEQLGVPQEQVFPSRSEPGRFPQDEFLAGDEGLIRPRRSLTGDDTRYGVRQLARDLHLPSSKFNGAGPGGDLHFIERGGEQYAYFGSATVDSTVLPTHIAEQPESDQKHLQSIATTMHNLSKAGVPLANIMPLGRPASGQDLTYGDVMQRLTPSQRSRIPAVVREQLQTMRDLPFPQEDIDYHTDVFTSTASDGRQMFVRQSDADDAALRATLGHFGFEALQTPYGRLVNPQEPVSQELQDRWQSERIPVFEGNVATRTEDLSVNYSNMVTGRLPDGRQTVLMPTEAMDPEQLTGRDREMMASLQANMPDALIVPIGGRSAITGFRNRDEMNPSLDLNQFSDGSRVMKNWGAHCMVNVLPYVIDIPQATAGSR